MGQVQYRPPRDEPETGQVFCQSKTLLETLSQVLLAFAVVSHQPGFNNNKLLLETHNKNETSMPRFKATSTYSILYSNFSAADDQLTMSSWPIVIDLVKVLLNSDIFV